MKCSNCGGELTFKEGKFVCVSCGTVNKFDTAFESGDVYLCYTENDAQGRRTKDSIIAEEIFKNLQSKKISAFFEHISSGNVIGDELDMLRLQAMYQSKIILVIGTQKDNFDKLLSKYSDNFADKIVIPVYADILPKDMPSQLSKFQALNYNAVGSSEDLIRNVLKLLGREQELDIEELNKNSQKKKKIIIISAISTLLVIIAAVAIILLIPKNKGTEQTQLSNQDIYDQAQSLMKQEKYIDSLKLLKTISGYKDSDKLIKKIYDRYDGYYLTKDENTLFYINIQDSKIADITLKVTKNGEDVSTSDSAEVNVDKINMSFTDSLSNKGTLAVTLKDKGFDVKTTSESKEKTLTLGGLNLSFDLSQRTDRPKDKEITKQTILEWISKKTTLAELQKQYKMTCLGLVDPQLAHEGSNTSYKISDADISLFFIKYDLSKTKYDPTYNEEYFVTDEFYLVAVMAPAEILAKDRIGSDSNIFTEGEVTFFPNVTRFSFKGMYNPNLNYYIYKATYKKISNSTRIGVLAKPMLGQDWYDDTVNYSIEQYIQIIAEDMYSQEVDFDTTKGHIDTAILENKGNKILIEAYFEDYDASTNNISGYYECDKSTYTVKLITITDNLYGISDEELKKYPDVFKEYVDKKKSSANQNSDYDQYYYDSGYDDETVDEDSVVVYDDNDNDYYEDEEFSAETTVIAEESTTAS